MTVSGEKLDVTGDGDGLRLVADNPSPGLAALRLGKRFKKRPLLRDVSLYVQRGDRKSTRLNSSHSCASRLPSSALQNNVNLTTRLSSQLRAIQPSASLRAY